MNEIELPSLNQQSPVFKAFYEFDVAHIAWGNNDYILNAINQAETPIAKITRLWNSEIHWRYGHKQNIVASHEGAQGSGKSMPQAYNCLLIGSVFGVPFNVDNVCFTPEDLKQRLQNSKSKETFLRDEHLFTRAGIMSNFNESNLSDYEEQLRISQNNLIFCSVELQNHAHFFQFESGWTNFNEEGYPVSFISVLKTPRFTNRKEFVWRGYIEFPMPNKDFVEAYLKKKHEHIENLKKMYGNTLDPIPFYANKIFNEKESSLIQRTKEGFIKPIKAELMQLIMSDVIGTRMFTLKGQEILLAKLKQLIQEKFEPDNNLIAKQQEALRLKKNKKISEILEDEDNKAAARRKEKLEFMREKLAEDKRKNDLKEQSLKLKEEMLNLQKEKQKEETEKLK